MPSPRKRKLRRTLGTLLGTTALTDAQKGTSGFIKNLIKLRTKRYDGPYRPFGEGSVVAHTEFDTSGAQLDNFAATKAHLGATAQLDANVGIQAGINAIDATGNLQTAVGGTTDDDEQVLVAFEISAGISSTGAIRRIGFILRDVSAASAPSGQVTVTDGTNSIVLEDTDYLNVSCAGLVGGGTQAIARLNEVFTDPTASDRITAKAAGSTVATGLDSDITSTIVRNAEADAIAGLALAAVNAGPGTIRMVVEQRDTGLANRIVPAGAGTYDFTAGHDGLPLANTSRYIWDKDGSSSTRTSARILNGTEGILYSPNGPSAKYVPAYDTAAGTHATSKYIRIKPTGWADGKKISFLAKSDLAGDNDDGGNNDDYVQVKPTADGDALGGQDAHGDLGDTLAGLDMYGPTADTSSLVEVLWHASNAEGFFVAYNVATNRALVGGLSPSLTDMRGGWALAWKVDDPDVTP